MQINGDFLPEVEGRVIESGKNSLGTYIKYDNGVMICFNRVTLKDCNFQLYTGGASQALYIDQTYSGIYIWTYPASFVNTEQISVHVTPHGSGYMYGSLGLIFKDKVTTYFATSYPWSGDVQLCLFTIGHWKVMN